MPEDDAVPTVDAARYGPWAVVAGASEGVGASLVERLAAVGINPVLVARNAGLLEELAARVRARHGVDTRVVVLDLARDDAAAELAAATDGLEVGLVVHNAGAVNRTGPFLDTPLDVSADLVRLNCTTPMRLAHHFLPPMQERGRGGLVLIGSLAGLSGAANVAVYSAAKIFSVHLAEGLWAELRGTGVDVCAAVLGSVRTPAAARQGVVFDPDRDMEPDDVAREVLANLGNGPTHVVGEQNRALASTLWTVERRVAVELLSAATGEFSERTDQEERP